MTYLVRRPIDIAELIAEIRRDGDGGIALFLGAVRNENRGESVSRIEYTAYETMAEREMGKIEAELASASPQTRLRMRHRLGMLALGEISVAVVASSPHRKEALSTCREAIERIKARVPIWKKEFSPAGDILPALNWEEPS